MTRRTPRPRRSRSRWDVVVETVWGSVLVLLVLSAMVAGAAWTGVVP
ncbi:hypothetical protein EDD28_2444 [Salana multivorans]|uniref:Uncharacterized protein n=1 Tax=Salana multivorans TaxID=120377 RepID=A0A3N2DDG1_9MICO|nr:hypothetical protein EDD28_2444 [Salana multivorans]